MGTHPIFESDFDCLTDMSRLALIERYARVWNKAPWVERLMWNQQEKRYMWNSEHAWDGGAFYRSHSRFTDRAVPPTKMATLWGHYHPEQERRENSEHRLFQLTSHLAQYGVGRIVYNKYERSFKSSNVDLITA